MKTNLVAFALAVLSLSACKKERDPMSYVLKDGLVIGSLSNTQVSEIFSEYVWIESQDKALADKYRSKLDSLITLRHDSTAIDIMRKQFIETECKTLEGSP